MTPAQRAVLAAAKKAGLKPSEQAREFLLHDVVEACLQQMRNYSVAWKNLSEKEQDASIASLTDALKESVTDAIRIMISAGTSAIPFKLKSLKIDGKLTVTGLVEGDHPERHALTDKAHDKSEILLILSPRDYFEGLEDIKGEKDQKSLPLDDSEPAKQPAAKPASKDAAAAVSTPTGNGKTGGVTNVSNIAGAVAFKAGELDKARKFLEQFRNPSVKAVQQAVACGYNKGEAILAELVRLGEVICVIDESGTSFVMPSLNTEPTDQVGDTLLTEGLDDAPLDPAPVVETPPARKRTKAQQKKADEAAAKAAEAAANVTQQAEQKAEDDPDFSDSPLDWGDKLTDALYDKIKAKVIKDQKVSAGALAVAFDCPIPIIDEAIDRLEMEAVISEMDDAGGREVFDQE